MTIKYPLQIAAFIYVFFMLSVVSANAYEFPPYEGLALKIDGKFTESYSNNLTFTSDRNDRVEDFLTMLSIGLDAKYEGKRRAFGFSGRLNRRIRTDTSDIQNSSENLTVNFQNEISYYDRLNISDTYTHSQLPGSFEGEFDIVKCREELGRSGRSLSEIYTECNRFKEEFSRFNGGHDTYNNTMNFAYNKFFSEHISIVANYAHGQNWSNQQGTQDSNTNNLSFMANYLYSELTRFSLLYGYATSKYENGNVINTDTINAGINQYLSKRLSVNVSAGVVFEPHSTTNSFSASINNEIDEKTFATLTYSRGIDISSDTENIFRNWQVSGQLNRQFLEDLNSSLSVFYGEGEYDPEGMRDEFVGASALLNYNFWTNKRGAAVNGTLGYTYSEMSSTDDSREYDRTTLASTLNMVF
ncbi:MAG: hypothetical protein OEU95_08205 [Nitrospirota bacterium]|nr:hypothetical protein [Nitrospirota bacterium]